MQISKGIAEAIFNRFTLKANNGPIGIGLIGVGGWGRSNAVSIMRSQRFTIHGAYDIQENVARKFAGRYKVRHYDNIVDLLAEPTIQAVCITVPNPFHKDLVLAVADAGKHIFIEKPLAFRSSDCWELGNYCNGRQVLLQVGHQMRRDPVFREIKRILETGALGRPLFAQGVYTLERRSRNDWRQDASACPGGSMEQLGVHLIDVLMYLFGPPHDSHGWGRNIPRQSDAPDWGSITLSFDKEVRATISTSFSSPYYMRLECFLDRGNLVTDGHTLWIKNGDSKLKIVKPKGISGNVSQFNDFADCIEYGKQPETGAAEAATLMASIQSMLTT